MLNNLLFNKDKKYLFIFIDRYFYYIYFVFIELIGKLYRFLNLIISNETYISFYSKFILYIIRILFINL